MKHLILVWHAFQYHIVVMHLALSTVVMDDRLCACVCVCVCIRTIDDARTVLVPLFARSWNFDTDMKEYWNLIVVSSVLDAGDLVETFSSASVNLKTVFIGCWEVWNFVVTKKKGTSHDFVHLVSPILTKLIPITYIWSQVCSNRKALGIFCLVSKAFSGMMMEYLYKICSWYLVIYWWIFLVN